VSQNFFAQGSDDGTVQGYERHYFGGRIYHNMEAFHLETKLGYNFPCQIISADIPQYPISKNHLDWDQMIVPIKNLRDGGDDRFVVDSIKIYNSTKQKVWFYVEMLPNDRYHVIVQPQCGVINKVCFGFLRST
jgi:hypothetical protein